jgi:hypothetical protein
MERRGDLDPAPPAGCHPARAATGSCEADVAGSGVADAAGRDAAGQAPRRAAAHRRSSSILRWHRDILRRRWARRSRCGRAGRPRTRRSIRSLVLRLAREMGREVTIASTANSQYSASPWPSQRFGRSSKTAGMGPAPRRDCPGWAEFLRSQAQAILALNFFTADLLNGAKVYVLAVIEHGSHRIRVSELRSTQFSPGWCSKPGTS